jgi:hypothetical protein
MTRFFTFLRKNALQFQQIVFLIMAIVNIGSSLFWAFLGASALFAGLQDILDELRKTNNNGI